MHTTRSTNSQGQAAISLVLAITIMLATGAGILATNAVQHDPLVQSDVIQYFSYRSLEAGMNAFLSQVNTNPNLINCSSTSPAGGQCDPSNYETWIPISSTMNVPGVVPEWYMWGNPAPTPNSNLTSAQVPIYGAAGFPGHIIDYENSTINLKAVNGFLTRVWWSNYEATDPALVGNAGQSCLLDWKNSYNGPGQYCQPVYFLGGDQVYGPIYSNDSIYVANDPTLGAVHTADPNCQFVGSPGSGDCYSDATANNNNIVTQSPADQAGSSYGHPIEPLPQSDSQLAALAASNVNGGGCTYYGPTTITLDPNDQMTIWSPDTPLGAKNAVGTTCYSGPGKQVQVPNGTYGNGVIYVQTASSTSPGCKPGANPFDNYVSSSEPNGPQAQWMPASMAYFGKTYYDYPGGGPGNPDCEADAFVSDSTASGSGISGQLTIAANNDVIITGNLQYLDCGSTFNSTNTGPCQYNASGVNDALGLVANQYVEVNHPVYPCYLGGYGQPNDYYYNAYCIPVGSQTNYGANGPSYDVSLPNCTSSQLGTPAAALCDPGPNVTIDAAILALNHSFVVNNWYVCGGISCENGNGTAEGTLTVYGSIDQNYRGPVGVNYGYFSTGYTKYYSWDYRLSYVSPPYYMTPGTPSWSIVSSSTSLSSAPPTCGTNPCPTP